MSKAISKYIIAFLTLSAHTTLAQSTSHAVTVNTTSGQLIGLVRDGVQAFRGIRFAEAPVGNLRWAPPQPFLSTEVHNATSFGASCIPQYSSQTEEDLFNNGGPTTSDEDCLFLNVWTSTKNSGTPKPVLFWIYGGSLAFGSSALPTYDGTIFAKNQDVVVVSLNYRLNIFGFPLSPDLPPEGNNLGLLDQDLALQWVQKNIAQFGGDPEKVTVMGQSAGGRSVSSAFLRYTSETAPFRAGIMLSGSSTYSTPLTNHTPFDAFAQAVNCTQKPGPARLDCLRAVPADVIANLTNAEPNTFNFDLTIDNVTSFANPLERIAANQTALKPILLGNMEGDGTIWALGFKTLREALVSYMGEFADAVTDDEIRALYTGQNDSVVMPNFIRDWQYRCAAGLWAKAFVEKGESNVFRYTYGATFPNLKPIPTLGAWHGSELPEIFGTFPSANATTNEATLSAAFQTTIANFIKDPTTPPAKPWLPYVPSNSTNALAKLAYNGNVQPDNFVVAVPSESLDGPCEVLYNRFLNFTT